MKPPNDRLAELFAELSHRDAASRSRTLEELRAQQPALTAELESLLAAHDTAGLFLDHLDHDRAAGLLRFGERLDMPEFAGPFRLVSEIGRGGLGVVYLAEREGADFEQRVAVKLLKRGMDSDLIIRRFEAERRILASLEHPNISRLIDGGVLEDGRPWFAMEYIEGMPLTDWCDEHGLSIDARVSLFEKVCRAAQFAHSRLIVHRDLKPANILVTDDGTVKLLDFGIAKLLDEEADATELTTAGIRAMTRDYAAPEQIRGEPVSAATDVHALGVVLYELLAGTHPYRRPDQGREALTRAICETEPDLPSTAAAREESDRRRSLHGDLDAIVMTAMAKQPEKRYGSAEAMAEDLRRYLDDQPIRARRKTTWYRMALFMRRHRLGVLATAAVVLALLAGLLLAAWQAQRAAEEAALARLSEQRAEQEAARSRRTLDFLTELFRGGDPRQGQPVESITELLSAGEQRARVGLAEDSLLQAQVMLRLAQVRYNRAEHEAALALASATIEQLEAGDSAQPALLADAYRLAGESQYQLDADPQAEPLLRRAVALYEAAGDEGSALRAMSTLAGVLRHSQSYAQAVEMQQELLDRTVARLGSDHPDTLGHRFGLAVFATDLGDYALAERQLRIVIEGLERSPDENRVELANAVLTLASLLDRTGRHDDAGPLFERGVAIRLELFDPGSDPVADALFSHGIFLLGQDRLPEAESAFRRVTEAGGAAPSTRAHGWRYLGRALRDQGRYEEALAALATAEAAYLDIGGRSMRLQAHRAAADRGYALALTGESEAAVDVLTAAVGGIEAIRGDSHYDLIQPLGYLGVTLRDAGRPEARTILERAAGVAETVLGPEHRFTREARARLNTSPTQG